MTDRGNNRTLDIRLDEDVYIRRAENKLRTIEKINKYREEKLLRELQDREQEERQRVSVMKLKNERYRNMRELMKTDQSNPVFVAHTSGKSPFRETVKQEFDEHGVRLSLKKEWFDAQTSDRSI